MTKFIFPFLFFFAAYASGQERHFGLGVVVGEPTGISAKYWTTPSNALTFGVGWYHQAVVWVGPHRYYYAGTRLHIHADYLWHSFEAIQSTERFPLHYGIGARLETGNAFPGSFGVRGVVGLSWLPRGTPLDVFLELAPTLFLAPSTGIGMGAGIGVRYFI
jgi:hypothetical protein